MKKFLILSFLFALALFSANAKNLRIVEADYNITLPPNSEEIKAHCIITNDGTDPITVGLKFEPIEIAEEHDVLFCFGFICYPPMKEPFEPISTIVLNPNQNSTNNEFYVTFNPNGYEGISRVKFIFFDTQNPEDSVHYDVVFNATTLTVQNTNESPEIHKISTENYLDLSSLLTENPIEIKIYSSAGKLLSSESKNLNLIDLSSFPNGVYFIFARNEKNSKKIIVLKN